MSEFRADAQPQSLWYTRNPGGCKGHFYHGQGQLPPELIQPALGCSQQAKPLQPLGNLVLQHPHNKKYPGTLLG